MTEATVQQPATTTREQIWLNREQVRKAKVVYRALKRVQDVFFSLLALIVLLPLMLIVVLAIVIDDPKGSPIFTQVRSGIDGKEFRIHKFRSMCVDAEAKLADLKRRTEMNGPIFKQKDDPRITRVGHFIRKTSIDELPQLVNILKGDMSIVGPRPEMLENVDRYTREVPEFAYRQQMKAGLTGLAQIEGKYNTSPKDKAILDLLYIENFSLSYDFKLMLRTLTIFFRRDSTEGFGEKAVDCPKMRVDSLPLKHAKRPSKAARKGKNDRSPLRAAL